MAFAVNSCPLPCIAFAAIALSSFVFDLSVGLDLKRTFAEINFTGFAKLLP